MDNRFRSITIEDRDAVEVIRAEQGHVYSSHAFVSLYLWKKAMKLSILRKEDLFVIKSELRPDKREYFFPCGNEEAVVRFVEQLILGGEAFSLHYMRDEDRSLIERRFFGRFDILPDEDSREYLYDKNAFLTLEGKAYRHVRSDLNRLEKEHEIKVFELTAERLEDAHAVVSAWNDRKDCGSSGTIIDDHETALFLLDHFEEMQEKGIILYADGEAAAVAAGSMIAADTFDLQMTKMKSPYRGLMFRLLYELYDFLPEEITVINREEDLGIEGLRQYKMSLNPFGFNETFSAYFLN